MIQEKDCDIYGPDLEIEDGYALVLAKHLGLICIVRDGLAYYHVEKQFLHPSRSEMPSIVECGEVFEPLQNILINEAFYLADELDHMDFWRNEIIPKVKFNSDYIRFPVYKFVLDGKSYLVLEQETIRDAMVSQILKNPWIVPIEVLEQHVSVGGEWVKITDGWHIEYSRYANHANDNMLRIALGNYAKMYMEDHAKFVDDAIKLFKPEHLLSTFDRESSWEISYHGSKYTVFDAST